MKTTLPIFSVSQNIYVHIYKHISPSHFLPNISVLKVEQRRKEALSKTGEEGQSDLESSLQDVVSRYGFKDLWPCSSRDLNHLARQEWRVKNVNKKSEDSGMANGTAFRDKGPSVIGASSTPSPNVVYPNTSRMVNYDSRQIAGPSGPAAPAVSNTTIGSNVSLASGGTINAPNEFLNATPPGLLAFMANLPVVDGPTPDVDFVLSVCLQSSISIDQAVKQGIPSARLPVGPVPSTSNLSGPSKHRPAQSNSSRHSSKRRDLDREDDETTTVQSQPQRKDIFKMRQLQKARGVASQTGSTSYGSAFSGEYSGSTG